MQVEKKNSFGRAGPPRTTRHDDASASIGSIVVIKKQVCDVFLKYVGQPRVSTTCAKK